MTSPATPSRWVDRLNPLILRCARSRLRTKHLVTWGLITLVITSFFFLMTYLTSVERRVFSTTMAARLSLMPLFVIQAFILMLLGTGSVATGIALEKDSGILDFHRMTPMSIPAKIAGYLMGLPIREYYMFALTIPFVIFAAIMGRVSFLKLLHFYAVFFSGVLLYHLTGMVAGLISKRPRRASWIAQATVILLYLVLPQLGRFGFSAFSYLTIVPTFRSLFAETVGVSRLFGTAFSPGTTREVPFFDLDLPPSLYTILLQGFVSLTFILLVARKWRDEARPSFSKPYAVIFYGVLMFLMVGSLWPHWNWGGRGLRALFIGRGSVQIFFFISLVASVFLLHIVTPTGHGLLRGLRRARKLKQEHIPFTQDGAPSGWVAGAFILLTLGAYLMLVFREGPIGPPPNLGRALMLPAVFALVVLYTHAARTAWGGRGLFLVIFGVWIVPLLIFAIVAAAFGVSVPVAYLACLSPLVSLEFAAAMIRERGSQGLGGLDPTSLTIVSLSAAAALTLLFSRFARKAHRKVRSLHEQEGAPSAAELQKLA